MPIVPTLCFLSLSVLFLLVRVPFARVIPTTDRSLGDYAIHQLIIERIRQNGHRIPEVFSQFLLDTVFDYPALFHKLCSYLPERWFPFFYRYNSTLWDYGQLSLIFWGGYLYAGLVKGWERAGLVAAVASLMMILTPLYLESLPKVLFGPRACGDFLGALSLVALFFSIIMGEWPWLPVAALMTAIAVASSKFAFQAIVLGSLAGSVLLGRPRLFLYALGCVLASVPLSLGYTWRVLRGTLRHSFFYKTHLLQVFLKVPPRSFLAGFWDFIRGMWAYPQKLREAMRPVWGDLRLALRPAFEGPIMGPQKSPIHWLGNFLVEWLRIGRGLFCQQLPWFLGWWRVRKYSFPGFPARVLLLFPWLIPAALFALSGRGAGREMAWFGLGGFVVCCFISLPPMRFLGEPQRYISYTAAPLLWFLAGKVVGGWTPWFWACGALAALLFLWYYLDFHERLSSSINAQSGYVEGLEEAIEFLRPYQGCRILCIPLRMSFVFCWALDLYALHVLANAPPGENLAKYKALVPVEYPFPDVELDRWIHDYAIDFLVVEENHLNRYQEAYPDRPYRLEKYPLVFRAGGYTVFSAGGEKEEKAA